MYSNRPSIVLLDGGIRPFREHALASIANAYDVVLLQTRQPAWERQYIVDAVPVGGVGSVDDFVAACRIAEYRRPVAGVLTYTEFLVEAAAMLADELDLPHPPLAAVRDCRNKAYTRERLAAAGVPSARAIPVASLAEAQAAAEAIGFPVVVKPVGLEGSVGVVRADTPADLNRCLAVATQARIAGVDADSLVLVEEFLPGDEVSVECVTQNGHTDVVAVSHARVGLAPSDPFFQETGRAVRADEPLAAADSPVAAVARDALAAVGFTEGVAQVEIKLTDSGPHVIEINARLGGDLVPYLVQLATGVDLARAAADLAVGGWPDLTPNEHEAAAVRFFYPAHNGRLDKRYRGPNLDTSPPWLDQLTWLAEPGDELRLPPEDYLGRLGLAVVRGSDLATCQQRLDHVERNIHSRLTPLQRAEATR